MGKFKEFMEKNRAKDIYAPMLADYDLKSTIELKNKLNRHNNKVFFAFMVPFLFFAICGASYLLLCPYLIDWGLLVEDGADKPGYILLILGYMFLFMAFGYNFAISMVMTECNKRVETIAGVEDGTQKKD